MSAPCRSPPPSRRSIPRAIAHRLKERLVVAVARLAPSLVVGEVGAAPFRLRGPASAIVLAAMPGAIRSGSIELELAAVGADQAGGPGKQIAVGAGDHHERGQGDGGIGSESR